MAMDEDETRTRAGCVRATEGAARPFSGVRRPSPDAALCSTREESRRCKLHDEPPPSSFRLSTFAFCLPPSAKESGGTAFADEGLALK